jgi:large subunit ribosomal protein L24
MTLASQGRSAAALIGALSGSGTVTLDGAKFAGLDPRAFEVAVRASDNGQARDDARLKQIVEPALSAGALSVGSVQMPFTIRDGRMRVAATTIDAQGVRAVISGGYDIPADQADIRAALTLATPTSGKPEIQLFAAGTPDALTRTVDVAALSSWLAVRAIDHETRRLDAIERGEPPPPPPTPISIPQAPDAEQDIGPSAAPLTNVPLPGRDPRRLSKQPPKAAPPPRPPVAAPLPSSTQVAPLPPPIDVKPAPGTVAKPKPKPPLALTPQVANPPPRPAAPN